MKCLQCNQSLPPEDDDEYLIAGQVCVNCGFWNIAPEALAEAHGAGASVMIQRDEAYEADVNEWYESHVPVRPVTPMPYVPSTREAFND